MTQNDPQLVPEGVDLDRPNAARTYDWFLGGTANWAIDREFGEQAVRAVPLVKTLAKTNRDFLGRVVAYCARQGITQFLDLGSGVPTVGNVHEVADEVTTDARCVYVDYEPVAVAHSEVLLEQYGDPRRHTVARADMNDVDAVVKAARATGILDLDQPIALLMIALLHFVPKGQAEETVRRYKELLPAGSYLAISHATNEGVPAELDEQLVQVRQVYQRSSTPVCYRTHEEFGQFFGGLELVEPGVSWLPRWRAEERGDVPAAELAADPSSTCLLGAVGYKRP